MNVDDEFWKTVLDNLYDGVYFVDGGGRISYWNKGAERITGFRSDEVMGAYCWENVKAHMSQPERPWADLGAGVSASAMGQGLYIEEEASVIHSEGHKIPVATRTALFRDFQCRVTGAVVLFSDNRAVEEARRKIELLEGMALLDHVTELGNRKYADAQIRRALEELRRYGWPFGLLVIRLNDPGPGDARYDEEARNAAMRAVARTLSGKIRSSDVLARWSEQELVAILLNASEKHIPAIAAKLRLLATGLTVESPSGKRPLSISIKGTASRESDDAQSLVSRVEAATELGEA